MLESIVKTELSLSQRVTIRPISVLESIVKTELSLSAYRHHHKGNGLRVL